LSFVRDPETPDLDSGHWRRTPRVQVFGAAFREFANAPISMIADKSARQLKTTRGKKTGA
jgi:hypothetical protein